MSIVKEFMIERPGSLARKRKEDRLELSAPSQDFRALYAEDFRI